MAEHEWGCTLRNLVQVPPRPLALLLGDAALHAPLLQYLVDSDRGRCPLTLRSERLDYVMPPPKRSIWHAYDGTEDGAYHRSLVAYIPGGILPARWIDKHLHELPAVIALVFRWDPTEDWAIKEAEIAQQAAGVRYNNQLREVPFVVAIIRESYPHEDIEGLRRKVAPLAKRADLSSKKSVVLLTSEDFEVALVEFEQILCDVAREQCKKRVKFIKKKQGRLNQQTQSWLLIRYCFKLGLFAQMYREDDRSLEHYDAAFDELKRVTCGDMSIHEVKAVASFVTFLACQIHITNGRAKEAQMCFDAHIRIFRGRIGPMDVSFLHWGWMQFQMALFGELLAINTNATSNLAVQPSVYYELAAMYASKRHQATTKALIDWAPQFDAGALEYFATENSFFIGQMPREDINQENEELAKAICTYRESKVDLIGNVTALLRLSYEDFKCRRAPRSIVRIATKIATHYYETEEFELARKLLDRVASSYREGHWLDILCFVLFMSMRCAIALELPLDVIRYSTELLTPGFKLSTSNRIELQNHIMESLHKLNARPDTSTHQIIIDPMWKLLVCEIAFSADRAAVDEIFTVYVSITSHFPQSITFSYIRVVTTDNECDCLIAELLDGRQNSNCRSLLDDCKFQPGESRLFSYSVSLSNPHSSVECREVTFALRASPASLEFRVANSSRHDACTSKYICVEPLQAELDFKLHHDPPALCNEFYEVKISFSDSITDVVEGEISCSICDLDAVHPPIFVRGREGKSFVAFPPTRSVLQAIEGGNATSIFVQASLVSTLELSINVSYRTARSSHWLHVSKKNSIEVIHPFDVRLQFFEAEGDLMLDNDKEYTPPSLSLNPINIHASLRNVSPHRIIIDSIECDLIEGFQQIGGKNCVTGAKMPLALAKSEVIVALMSLRADIKCTAMPGVLCTRWHRLSSTDLQSVNIALPERTFFNRPLQVSMNYPPTCTLTGTVALSITIRNQSSSMCELCVKVQPSDSLLVSGCLDGFVSILPRASTTLDYNLAPLQCGHIDLPIIDIVDSSTKRSVLDPASTATLFVLPLARSC